MGLQRRGGKIEVKVGGVTQDAKGSFTYDLGYPKRDPIIGSSAVHGFSEKVKVAFIEGKITDKGTLDLKALVNLEDTTATLVLANGKAIVLRDAWYAGDGVGDTEEGELMFRMESSSEGVEV